MRRQKKNQSGSATSYVSQKQAMRRLQLGLSNFRRLCILKGVYPVEPKNKKKAGRGNSEPRIYFHAKDVAFLAREPLIETFRALRIHQRRLKRAREKLDRDKEFRLRMKKPTYTLHQLVKERYPTRRDALRDLSDSLNLLFLLAEPNYSQLRGDLIQTYRIVRGRECALDFEEFLEVAGTDRLPDHPS
nr:unnamed protein product [Spirometra erinaceieuropaei]